MPDPRPLARAWPALLGAVLLLLGCATSAAAVPTLPYDPTHARWDRLLHAHVRQGVVDYTGLRGPGRPELDAYLGELSSVASTASWSRSEALAFWINAYNAWTVKLVVDHPGVTSIKKITTVGSPWKLSFIPMRATGADTISLDDIEHGVLRPRFADPRIHVAVVCASVSCPPLRNEAYVPARLDAQLDDQARTFLADARHNRVDTERRVLRLSSLFDWYAEDFSASGGVRGFLERHGPPAMVQAARDGWPIEHLDYDWGLNGR